MCFMVGSLNAEGAKVREPEYITEVSVEADDDMKTLLVDSAYVGRMGGYVFLASKKYVDCVAIPEGRVKILRTFKKARAANQALQTTPMTRSVYEKTIEFRYPQRGV